MSTGIEGQGYLDRGVEAKHDHLLGNDNASITLVEYGSYDCPHCRAANSQITEVRNRFGDRLRYAYRHRPIPGSDIARRAAELVELAKDPKQFWDAHVVLMTRSETLTEDDLRAVADQLSVADLDSEQLEHEKQRARERVERDIESARASGVRFTPTFFINSRRYDGPWDENSLANAMLNSLGHRISTAALTFAKWAPSTGLLLAIASIVAVFVTNSSFGPAFQKFWHLNFGFMIGSSAFQMSILHWVNDGLLTIFFFVVGLEIKREFTVGHLAGRRSAALPIAAAIGGMTFPALLYSLLIPNGPWAHGWGVPIATDTAFAVALIAIMGHRVPVELRIFLTAAAIVDDIGAIIVVALFYSTELHFYYLAVGVAIVVMLWLLNRGAIYAITPYILLGLLLWACVYAGGLHSTFAGVILAAFIPTRPPPDFRTLALQADTILKAEALHEGEQYRRGPSEPALRALDEIHDRLESPADRMLRTAAPRSSYFVLPIFALANAGVEISTEILHGREILAIAVIIGLVIGKPFGFITASALAVRLGVAEKPDAYSWMQLLGAGALAGIGFTMSLFIAGQAFPVHEDFASVKIAIFTASLLAAVIGVFLLWKSKPVVAAHPIPPRSVTVCEAAPLD